MKKKRNSACKAAFWGTAETASSFLPLYNEGADVITRLLIVLRVGTVTQRKLLGPPASAVHCFVSQVLDVKSVHHFWVVFLQVQVYPGLTVLVFGKKRFID